MLYTFLFCTFGLSINHVTQLMRVMWAGENYDCTVLKLTMARLEEAAITECELSSHYETHNLAKPL